MKSSRKVNPSGNVPDCIEYYDRRLDKLVRVENRHTGTVIRATGKHLAPPAKDAMIEFLIAEGFIAEDFRWSHEGLAGSAPSVTWVTDDSWVKPAHRSHRWASRAWRFMTWGRWLSIALFLMALAVALWLRPR